MNLLKSLACLLFSTALLQAGEPIRIVATFAPVYSLTKNVAGDAATVEQLLPPGAEPHGFAFSPGDFKKLAKADVIVENGLGIEEWMDKALATSKATRITAGKGIKLDDDNPHVWLDPILAIAQVENIRDGLVKRDPANAAAYKKNAADYIAKLRKLDAEIRETTKTIPDKRLLTAHSAFDYFAKRYGFEVVGVFEQFPGREPSPRALKKLRDTIRTNGVKVLFAEPGQSPRALRSLSNELKLPIAQIDPMEYGEPSAAFYETVTRKNLKNLQEALHGR